MYLLYILLYLYNILYLSIKSFQQTVVSLLTALPHLHHDLDLLGGQGWRLEREQVVISDINCVSEVDPAGHHHLHDFCGENKI